MRHLFTSLTAVSLIVILTACGARGDNLPPTATSFIDPALLTVQPGEFNPAPFGDVEEDIPNRSATENPGLDSTLEALGAPTRDAPVEGASTPVPLGGIGGNVEIPAAGVVARVDAPEIEFDPEAEATPSFFTFVEVYRGGGVTQDDTRIQISNDGTVTVNGVPTRNIGPQGANQIDQRLNEIDIYTITGQFYASIPDADDYQYVIQVQRGAESISLRADDKLIPRELGLLVAEVFQLAQGTAPPPPPPSN